MIVVFSETRVNTGYATYRPRSQKRTVGPKYLQPTNLTHIYASFGENQLKLQKASWNDKRDRGLNMAPPVNQFIEQNHSANGGSQQFEKFHTRCDKL